MKHLYLTLIVFLSLHIVGKSQSTTKETSNDNGMIATWIASARNNVEVLPKDDLNSSSAKASFTSVSPDAASALNELASDYGGILINHGWIRILGAGCKRLTRNLIAWNKGKSFTKNGDHPSYVLIADDAVGGFFAINTGGIDNSNINTVFYYGPNGLKWESTGLQYDRFMKFCFSGDIADFYSDFFWKGWQQDVKKLSGDQVVSCYPFLWTKEGKELKCNRKTVSIQKVWELYHHNDVAEVKKRNPPKQNTSSSLVYQKH